MARASDFHVPRSAQPKPQDFAFDLDAALASVVGLRSIVPADAFTAGILGAERAGNGVLIREDGLVLTIGYLIAEAETIWLTLADGCIVPGHALAYDQESGFGLVQALARVDVPALPIGDARQAELGSAVVIGGAGGRAHSVAGRVVARQEFAGYWEYVLEDAIFTAPAHPFWGGTALIGPNGRLLGIGSLQLEQTGGDNEHLNLHVPIDLLKPILDDLLKFGRPNRPARPWLGVYATEVDDKLIVIGVAEGGPADRAEIRSGDVLVGVAGGRFDDLASFFRKVWSLGTAGVDVPLTIWREGDVFDVHVSSGDRAAYLKKPRLH